MNYDWLPQIIHDLNGSCKELFWILIIPFTIFCLVIESLKLPENSPSVMGIFKRMIFAILFLLTFDEVFRTISWLGDGIANHLSSPEIQEQLKQVILKRLNEEEGTLGLGTLLRWKQAFVWAFGILGALFACLGYYALEGIIYFTYALLYIFSPLMILMWVYEPSAQICKNLYLGLIKVASWKVVFGVLILLLYHFSRAHMLDHSEDNLLIIAFVNFCIGAAILFVPFFTQSLFSSGLTNFASTLAGAPALLAAGMAKGKIFGAVKGWQNTFGGMVDKKFNAGVKRLPEFAKERGQMIAKHGIKGLIEPAPPKPEKKPATTQDLKTKAQKMERATNRAWERYWGQTDAEKADSVINKNK